MTVAACAMLVQRSDPDRFLAVMAAPAHVEEMYEPAAVAARLREDEEQPDEEP